MVTWLLVAIALTGTVLNVRQDRRGFILWAISNVGLAVVNVRAGQTAQAVLFTVYLGLAVWGWVKWGFPRHISTTNNKNNTESAQRENK